VVSAIKPSLNLSPKGWFALAIGIIILTYISVILDIPILRQILGVIFLVFLPGLLILLILKLTRLGLSERIVLTVGLSTAFLMFFGLVLNQVGTAVGYMTPLSTSSVILWLSLVFIALLITAYIRNKESFSSVLFHLELNTMGKLCLLLSSLLPLLSVLGMRYLNTSGNNAILLTGLCLIPVIIILITFLRHKLPKDVYPLSIVFISMALLMMFWLRSEYIWGHDVHREYYVFYMTQANSQWFKLEYSVFNSCLGISLLPAVFQSVLDITNTEYLFKGVFVLICAFTPLSVYVISKRYIGELYAFLAALFFAFQSAYLVAPGSPRTNLAVFFFALCIMIFFSSEARRVKQRVLLVIFMVATIVSHYATSYIFLFLILATLLAGLVLRRKVRLDKITPSLVMLFVVILYLWYSQITSIPFLAGVRFVERMFINLGNFFIEEARSPEIATLLAQEVGQKPFLSWIYYVITYASFAFIAAGVVVTLIKHKSTMSSTGEGEQPPAFLRAKFDIEYWLIAIFSCVFLVIMVVIPFVSIGYGMQRLYSQVAVILSTFFITGGLIISGYLKLNPRLLILLVLIPYFLFTTGTAYELGGIHNTLVSSESPGAYYTLTHEQEYSSAQWLAENFEGNPKIYTTSSHNVRRLTSIGKLLPYLASTHDFFEHRKIDGYIYLGYNNVVKGKLVGVGDILYDMSDYSDMFINKDKLYANGGSEVWR